MSIDDALSDTKNLKILPKNRLLDYVGEAVKRLGPNSEMEENLILQAYRILDKDENFFGMAAGFLVIALDEDKRRESALRVIDSYFSGSGVNNILVRKLVGALNNPRTRKSVKELLVRLGPSPATISPLVGALANDVRGPVAMEILASYGPECLKYIKEPESNSPRYQRIKELKEKLKT